MEGWTDAQADWMRHLKQLNADRLKSPVGLTALDIRRLKWEMEAQQAVLLRLANGKPLSAALGAVARYMTVYADLHIAWYAGRLEAGAMRQAVLTAREQMWDELRQGDEKNGNRNSVR